MEAFKIVLPKLKKRTGIKIGSVIKSKKTKAKNWRKRKHKKEESLKIPLFI
jgi:hypothetical protein